MISFNSNVIKARSC